MLSEGDRTTVVYHKWKPQGSAGLEEHLTCTFTVTGWDEIKFFRILSFTNTEPQTPSQCKFKN